MGATLLAFEEGKEFASMNVSCLHTLTTFFLGTVS